MTSLLAGAVRRGLCQHASAAPGPAAWALVWQQQARSLSTGSEAPQQQEQDVSSIGNDKVRRLADEIVGLTVLECSWLSEILRKKLNMEKPAFGAMPMMGAMPFGMAAPGAAAGAAAGGGGGEAAPAAEEKKEQTEFTVKLESFSAEGKIKVIKEIRAITNLGLKEAKELVGGWGGASCEGLAAREGVLSCGGEGTAALQVPP
jgi:large subunit ribosomal protein L7/L12